MDEYLPNSHRFKEETKKASTERQKVEKVVSGSVKTRKNNTRKFTDIFISEDISKIKEYIFNDVLIPNVKRMISEMVKNSIDIALYGEKRPSRGSNVSYSNYYDTKRDDKRQSEYRVRSANSFDDLLFDSSSDADEVLSRMTEIIDTYQFVKVSDLYELAGVKDIPYTSNRYGWTNIASAEIIPTRDGYYTIKLPRAVVID